MVNRPKEKGTAAETAVVGYLREHGWPYAERRALTGATDKGDVTGTPGLAWEVKAGTRIQMAQWVAEMLQERENAHAEHGVLVIKPRGRGVKSVDDWFAVMIESDFRSLCKKIDTYGSFYSPEPIYYMASRLGDQLHAARVAGPNPVLILRVRGEMQNPENWYRVMTLRTVVELLGQAGYGS